jgi:hypothetical protein
VAAELNRKFSKEDPNGQKTQKMLTIPGHSGNANEKPH